MGEAHPDVPVIAAQQIGSPEGSLFKQDNTFVAGCKMLYKTSVGSEKKPYYIIKNYTTTP